MKVSQFKAILKECLSEVLRAELKNSLNEILSQSAGNQSVPLTEEMQTLKFDSSSVPNMPAKSPEEIRAHLASQMGLELPTVRSAAALPASVLPPALKGNPFLDFITPDTSPVDYGAPE